MADKHYDVVVIGSGAGGASLAQAIAETGKSILILERGDYLERGLNNWNSTYVFVNRGYRTKELWYDKTGKPFHPNTHYWVGGNTTFYGAALFRLRPGDFEERVHAGGGDPRPGQSAMAIWRLTISKRNASGVCTANAGLIQPSPAANRSFSIRL
jgi:choline dehydrogenase-like flavoprotein